ncbi:uncharacterized protein A4U43_C09F8680 [Asparagus officinalis]|uniref:Uncharacterized protein n=1 Tax=Asparagus officinalis TaxID=4686 RepID=A0A5P1E9H4_ASPOF|nr:uncharacterized protein A4U43_C09F8680 [Asparagus officinalis]
MEVQAKVVEIAIRSTGPMLVVAQAKQKKSLSKVGNQGPKKTTEMAEIKVIHVEDESTGREERVNHREAEAEAKACKRVEIPVEIETHRRGEGALVILAKSTQLQGKEPAEEEVSPLEELGWSYPHLINEIESEKWDKQSILLIGSSRASEGSAQDSWVISQEKKKGGEAESEAQSTQVPSATNVSQLPSFGLGIDPNLAP